MKTQIRSPKGKFYAKRSFVEQGKTKQNRVVKFHFISAHFETWFLKDGGIVETRSSAHPPRHHMMMKPNLTSQTVFSKLGEKSITKLSAIYQMLWKHTNGIATEFDTELTNAFFVEDLSGITRMVTVYATPKGYEVDARAVDKKHKTLHPVRVFSAQRIAA